MKVWVVCLRDYGDNGWSIAAILDSEDKANQWIIDHPEPYFFYEIEEHELG